MLSAPAIDVESGRKAAPRTAHPSVRGARGRQAPTGLPPSRVPFVQRCPGHGDGDCPCRASRLTVGSPGDRYEQEAERTAEVVMRAPAGRRAPLQVSPLRPSAIARAELAVYIPDSIDEQELEDVGVQRRAAGAGDVAVSAADERSILGGGTPSERLPGATRADMEARFGHDFGDVRVHRGDAASQLAGRLRAKAFTVGSDVFFGGGQYEPRSAAGQHLLAHELTHVLQQRRGAARVQRSERDTAALCAVYVGYPIIRLLESYNCAGLAWRTYDYRANRAAELAAVNAGKVIGCSSACNSGEIKHWWWDYDMHLETPDGRQGPSSRDFHTVAGVSDRAGHDPDDVWSKNGQRPVYGPGTGPGFRPPARERATENDPAERPSSLSDGTPLYKVRSGFNERCACHGCPTP